MIRYCLYLLFLLSGISGCQKAAQPDILFQTHTDAVTGLHFANILKPDAAFNMFKYMYFYNGAGVGVADFNKDGNTDIFFSGNQTHNQLFLGKGNLSFKNVSQEAGIPRDGGWSTGVSVADVNADGWLDIYVCRVGNFETLHSKNQLLICTGLSKDSIPLFEDRAADYGLDFSGFSTQAVFFDYDMDGDLDLFLMNHAVHHAGLFSERSRHLGTYSALSGDRLYRNDAGKFTDVTAASGINSSEIGYGLGAVVTDVNMDGLPDLYIGNDFHENDYLYINRGNGTFSEEMEKRMRHTSQFSMGVDAADINNDGWPEIISADMLPGDPYILKRSLGEDAYDIFKMKIRYGYSHQYTRNNLQMNTGDGFFSETGLYAGVYATDWSWAPLWADFNHDGLKDLFISNGIPKRLNDMDYVSFVSNKAYQDKIRNNEIGKRELAMIEQFPEIKLPNQFFLNRGNGLFADAGNAVQGNMPTFSNGSAVADFDNDGDLDVVVSNIGDRVLLYENKTPADSLHQSVSLSLRGSPQNPFAIGSRLLVFSGRQLLLAEKYPVRGFQSSMEGPLHLGLGRLPVDSAWLVWPDNTFERLTLPATAIGRPMQWKPGLPPVPFAALQAFMQRPVAPVADITAATGITFVHRENSFNEFDREPLLPRMLSTEGPALAVADINHDGWEDIFIGGARNQPGEIWLQQSGDRFVHMFQPALAADSGFEDVDAVWADVNMDGHTDLLVASGGNEFYGKDEHLLPRLYLNDGKGILRRSLDALPPLYATWSTIAVHDVDGDNAPDIFLGGRAVPFAYGKVPPSVLLRNNGRGRFTDMTRQWAPGLQQAGFVTDALWEDMDGDGRKDLVVALEWGKIACYQRTQNGFDKKDISAHTGWWQCLLAADVNGDGKKDIVAGNLGSNARLTADTDKPVRLYVNDMDNNGITEQVLTYYLNGKEIPFANKDELMKQVPVLKKKYLYAGDFAAATLSELFGADNLRRAATFEATEMRSMLFINRGKNGFDATPLPPQAQWSNIRSLVSIPGTKTGFSDIWIGANFYENNIQMGRYDADRGCYLQNNGKAGFLAMLPAGPGVEGQVRAMAHITLGSGRRAVLMARNNDTLLCFAIQKAP